MTGGSGLEVTVNVGDGLGVQVDVGELERAVRAAVAFQGEVEGEISLTLLGDEEIAALNREYLSKDRPTDVIAFALEAPTLLGDVYVGVEQAVRQASREGVSLAEELVRLAVHGTLHVLGFDHPEGPARASSEMYAVQERLVRELRGGETGD